MSHFPISVVLAAAVLASTITACAPASTSTDANEEPNSPTVVAAAYPFEYAAQQIAGNEATVLGLTPAGVDPHDLELSAQQVIDMQNADLILYLPGFQPAVDEVVSQLDPARVIDVTAVLEAEPAASTPPDDPHIWLNPNNMVSLATILTPRIADLPGIENPASITDAGADYADRMEALASDYAKTLASCNSSTLIVDHEAFGHLAAAYGFTQFGASGTTPEAEPSSARIRELADIVTSQNIQTIYTESPDTPSAMTILADETGATVQTLNPLEYTPATGDYETVMRDNLAALATGLQCQQHASGPATPSTNTGVQ